MKALLVIMLASACATAPGPKRADESHRVPVNRMVPPEFETTAKANRASGTRQQPRREGEVEWR